MKKLLIYLIIIAVFGTAFNGVLQSIQKVVDDGEHAITMIKTIGPVMAYADSIDGPEDPPPPPPPMD